jgi:molybdopterin molybdotransferase
MEYMIPVGRAKELIAIHVQQLPAIVANLQEASGLVLAHDVVSACSIPAYPQSSMDGYALGFESVDNGIRLAGEMAAGSKEALKVEQGFAIRIFTGAAVPSGADTVVMQEKCTVQDGVLVLNDPNLKQGDNVRPVGSEITAGALALDAGTLVTPAAAGFLAGMGVHEVAVIAKPRVSIIVTGNELQQPGEPLGYGQVYEANSFALLAALRQLGIQQVPVYRSPDNLDTLTDWLLQALENSDMVLMTGGVSVGDYDFTLEAFDACDVKKVFHKIKQKPGKPILFGMAGSKPVFGLPGNPASVLTCFYQYVYMAMEVMTGRVNLLEKRKMPLLSPYRKPAGLTHFLKAKFTELGVELFGGQESYKLNSFARSNCLAVMPEDATELSAGELVEIHLLPS